MASVKQSVKKSGDDTVYLKHLAPDISACSFSLK